MAHREISKDTDLTNSCAKCGMKYAGPGHACGGEQLQHSVSDDEFCKMNRMRVIRDRELLITDTMLLVVTSEAFEHLLEACDIIDRQSEEIEAKNKALEEIRDNVVLDTTSVQWIEQRAHQALKGE